MRKMLAVKVCDKMLPVVLVVLDESVCCVLNLLQELFEVELAVMTLYTLLCSLCIIFYKIIMRS